MCLGWLVETMGPLPWSLRTTNKIRGLYLQSQMDMLLAPILILREWSWSQLGHMHKISVESELADTPLPENKDRGKRYVHLTL